MQANDIAIRVNHLGKCFRIYERPQDRIKQILSFNKKKYYRAFWALSDVNFSVQRGEAFGIIGRNGAGKSTLLQLLCQTLRPTTGQIEIHGRIAALLELGAGFNPEFTGEENIYMNGAILGYNRKEMNKRLDEIVAFADIGDFVYQPVKTYSSGMFVRLAFAVQAHVNPDVLIVDEALSVGDIFFQQKCAKRMQTLRESGTTLIFVSHDMSTVRDLCESAVYLRAGKVMFSGPSVEAIQRYFLETHGEEEIENNDSSIKMSTNSTKSAPKSAPEIIDQLKRSAVWVNQEPEIKAAKLIAVSVVNKSHEPTMRIEMARKLIFRILYQSFTDQPIDISIAFRNRYDHIINASGTYTSNIQPPIIKIGEFALCEIEVTCMIEAGFYTFCVFLGYNIQLPNRAQNIDETPWLGPINVVWDYENEKAPLLGMFGMPAKVGISQLTE